MSTQIRRAAMVAEGKRLAADYAHNRKAVTEKWKVEKSKKLWKAQEDYYRTLLQPKVGSKLSFRGEVVWYTPPDSADGLDVEQGKLLYIKSGVARVKAVTGVEKDIPLGNLEEKWKDRLKKLGVQVTDAVNTK